MGETCPRFGHGVGLPSPQKKTAEVLKNSLYLSQPSLVSMGRQIDFLCGLANGDEDRWGRERRKSQVEEKVRSRSVLKSRRALTIVRHVAYLEPPLRLVQPYVRSGSMLFDHVAAESDEYLSNRIPWIDISLSLSHINCPQSW